MLTMLLANYLDDLERVSGLGFGPFIALLIIFLGILGGVIAAGFVFFWKQLGKAWSKRDEERRARDTERAEWHAKVEKRLEETESWLRESDAKHEDCEKDRGSLRGKIEGLETDLQRMRRCHHTECPMRLPQ